MDINAMINGIPLIAVVIGLVEWLKGLGLSGRPLRLASMAVGLVLGLLYQASLTAPADLAAWFGAVVYGLALGLVGSGLYDAARSVIAKP